MILNDLPKNMTKNLEYLTYDQRMRLERNKAMCDEYIQRSGIITSGELKPQRLLDFLARKYKMTIMGVGKNRAS